MKKSLFIFFTLSFFAFSVKAQNIWLNEFHYDNIGTDEGEFIEIVLENAGSYNLADFAITLYNGNNGGSYDTKTLDQFTAGTVDGDFTIYYYDYPSNGIQNGESDGIAISYQGVLIDGQFLSYEGTLTATDGPANGETSTDIGVSESSTDVGNSLQLSGTGNAYGDFVWQEPAPETEGDLNNDQEFGTYTPDPEPSEYPTAFIGTPEGMNITLTWTDSGGEQLPAGYLIIGEESSGKNIAYTPPVDGVPVEDDFNWSDGQIAANVDFGVETFTIMVDASTNYNFVIFPYTNAGIYIDYKTDGTPPETSALSNNFVIINEDEFNLDLGTWSQYSAVGEQMWFYDPDHGKPAGCATMNGYSDGAVENEDWLISPNIGMTNVADVQLIFMSAYNYNGPALELLVSNDYDGTGNPNDFTWTDITNLAVWSDGGWVWTESGNVDINDYDLNCYLAFKYTSTTDQASTWEVDNIVVYGVNTVNVPELSKSKVAIYPNPATGFVNINCPLEGTVKVVALDGKMVVNSKMQKGINQLGISQLKAGIYITQFTDQNQNISINKLIVK